MKINFSFDFLQSQPIFLDHESCFNVFGPQIRVPRVEIVQKSLFPPGLIFSGFRPISGILRYSDSQFVFPTSHDPWKTLSQRIDLHWFSADQGVLWAIGPSIRAPRIELPRQQSQTPGKRIFYPIMFF